MEQVTPMTEHYFTVAELSRRWNVSDDTILRMRKAGRLRTSHVGPRLVRFAESEVLRIEAEWAAEGADDGPTIPDDNVRPIREG